MANSGTYLMENLDEAIRLELKTDPEVLRKQAIWSGLKSGSRVLDVGCGPGKTSSILHEMTGPGGALVGFDFSQERIGYARKHYGNKPGIEFHVRDFTSPLDGLGYFDLIWVRFVLEYHRTESPRIVENLTSLLKPGGTLCLLDLDHNCLNHYELPAPMEQVLFGVMATLEKKYDFDPYAGRKLYSYMYDLRYQDIQMDLMAHHLIYGELGDVDAFNWLKKMAVVSTKAREIFEEYPGGRDKFLSDFTTFFNDPRRFTYTPLILCKGVKPVTV